MVKRRDDAVPRGWSYSSGKFPEFIMLIIIISIFWLISEIGMLGSIEIPWLPLIAIIVSLGWLVNQRFKKG